MPLIKKNIVKYKRRITSGALALTLFVGGGSSAYAAHIQGSTSTPAHSNVGSQRVRPGQAGQAAHFHGLGLNHNRATGTIVALTSTGFTLEIHKPKLGPKRGSSTSTPEIVSFDIRTSSNTVYQKDGAAATAAGLAVGQKVVVVGTIDSTAQIVTATKVNVITKLPKKAK